MASTVTLEQYRYGKLVQRPGGPIVRGFEHSCTGRSAGFPTTLEALCRPDRLGLGLDDRFRWDKYPWLARGGIVSRLVEAEPVPYLLMARVRGRSEEGEGQPGRFYTEAVYAAVPLEDWHFAAIPALEAGLSAEPLTARDYQLPPLQLSLDWQETSLPPDWLESLRPYLRALTLGLPFAVQDWKAGLAPFLAQLGLVAASLPASLRWRLTFGAGLVDLSGDPLVALGMRARTALRQISSEIKGFEAVDASVGDRYLAWLEALAPRVRTPLELARAVDQSTVTGLQTRHITYDLGTPFKHAADQVVDRLAESLALDGLKAYLRGEREDVWLGFRAARREALVTVLDALVPRGLGLLPELSTEAWRAEWFDILTRAACQGTWLEALGYLLGMGAACPLPTLTTLRRLPFPEALWDRLVSALDRQLEAQPAAEIWAELVERREQDAPWLNFWRTQRAGKLVWAAAMASIQTHRGRHIQVALRELAETEAAEAWQLLSAQGAAPAPLVEVLLAGGIRGWQPVLDGLIEASVELGRADTALELAELGAARGLPSRLSNALIGDRLAGYEGLKALTEACAALVRGGSTRELRASEVKLLLFGWDQLSAQVKAALTPGLAQVLPSLACLLLLDLDEGTLEPVRDTPVHKAALEALEHAVRTRPDVQDRLLLRLRACVLAQEDSRELFFYLERWLRARQYTNPSTWSQDTPLPAGAGMGYAPKQTWQFPELGPATALTSGRIPALPAELSETSWKVCRRYLAYLISLPGERADTLRSMIFNVRTLDELEVAVRLGHETLSLTLHPHQLDLLIGLRLTQNEPELSRFRQLAREVGIHQQPGWRLLEVTPDELDPVELTTINRLSTAEKLDVLCWGWSNFPPLYLAEVKPATLAAARLSPEMLCGLAQLAEGVLARQQKARAELEVERVRRFVESLLEHTLYRLKGQVPPDELESLCIPRRGFLRSLGIGRKAGAGAPARTLQELVPWLMELLPAQDAADTVARALDPWFGNRR